MKKRAGARGYVILFILAFVCLNCRKPSPEIEIKIEDGIEVVINHKEPYILKGEPARLELQEMFTIDTEKEEIMELGLVDILGFDIDSEGNIYCYQSPERRAHMVFKFDKTGVFSNSFGSMGQGPGEIAAPEGVYITENDEVQIQDYYSKLVYFDRNGALVKEVQIDFESGRKEIQAKVPRSWLVSIIPLRNQNYLCFTDNYELPSMNRFDAAELYDSEFLRLKELDRCDYGPHFSVNQSKKVGTPRVFMRQVSNDFIFIGHEKRGYEIIIYDLDGNPVKKIRKPFNPVPPTQEFIEVLLNNMGRYKDRTIIPDEMPPFQYFFLDDDGRLYVQTYEKGENENKYIYDVFNPDGIFITRKSMPGNGDRMGSGRDLDNPKAKNKNFYCLRDKGSGYKELVVSKMIWD